MKYYTILELDTKYKPLLWKKPEIHNNLWWLNFDLQKWIEIKDWSELNKLFFEANYDVIEDYLPNTLPSPVISSKIKEDLEKEWVIWIQYLPIKLENLEKSSDVINWYYVLNILNRENEEVINTKISEKDPISYAKVWLDKNKLSWYDIFRIDWYDVKFFISEKLKNIINKYVHSVEFVEVKIA